MSKRLIAMGLLSGVLLCAPAARPQDPASAHIEAGLAAYRRLRFHEAERHFQAAVEANPGSAAARFYLAYSVYKIAEPKRPFDPEKRRAAELFAQAYALDPFFVPDWRIPGRP